MDAVIEKGRAPKTRDYFAELYVAGWMGDSKWNVYFPKRDDGFDFIATKTVSGQTIIRPVQVKGLYPTEEKTDKTPYRWMGRLSQTHPDMALVLVYFSPDQSTLAPEHIAFMPFSALKEAKAGWRVEPANFVKGATSPRPSYERYFGLGGMAALEKPNFR